jgi:hypothetical protein
MHPSDFLNELDRTVEARLSVIGHRAATAEPGPEIGVTDLLAIALRKELEASDEAALFMTREGDLELKIALARQCGDEAKHYGLIEARLRELGAEPEAISPSEVGRSRMFQFMAGLPTTVERVAAGQFTREALAYVHNKVFIEWCSARGDAGTARLYQEVIQPDEAHHHALGRKLLERLAIDDHTQELAREASVRTLELASEIQEIARLQRGIARAPGC